MVVKTFEEKVCEIFRVELDKISSVTRRLDVVLARHMLWWALQEYLGLSSSMLGREYKRDHTSIIRGVRSFEKSDDFEEYKTIFENIVRDVKIQRLLGTNVKEKPRLSTYPQV